jgi:fatty-acyl-CoA synthase
MAALVLGGPLEPAELEEFLGLQTDLSTKGWPRYVRIVPPEAGLPRTPTNKVLKRELAAEGPVPGDGELWVREERSTTYGPA